MSIRDLGHGEDLDLDVDDAPRQWLSLPKVGELGPTGRWARSGLTARITSWSRWLPGVRAVDPAGGRRGEAGLAGGVRRYRPLDSEPGDVAAVGWGNGSPIRGRGTRLFFGWVA